MPDASSNATTGRARRLIDLVYAAFKKHGTGAFNHSDTIAEVSDFLDLVSLEARRDAGPQPFKPAPPDSPSYASSLVSRGMDLLRQLQTEGYNDAEQMAVLAYAEAGTRTIWGSQIRKTGAKRQPPGGSA